MICFDPTTFARSLDPDFNIMEALKPYARRAALHGFEVKEVLHHMRGAVGDAGDLALRLPDDINVIITKLRQGKFQVRVQHEHLENLTKTVDKSSHRVRFALTIAALLVASSMLVPQQGTVLGLFTLQTMGIAGHIIAAIIGVWLVLSFIRSGRLWSWRHRGCGVAISQIRARADRCLSAARLLACYADRWSIPPTSAWTGPCPPRFPSVPGPTCACQAGGGPLCKGGIRRERSLKRWHVGQGWQGQPFQGADFQANRLI